jgi:hypothetical protein
MTIRQRSMPEIAGVVESLVVFRRIQPKTRIHEFHIHWQATNAKMGCQVKAFSEDQLYSLKSRTLARVGLSEQALTGNPADPLDVKLVLNFQREKLGKLVTTLSLVPEIEVLMTIPGSDRQIPIPVTDREFSHANPQDWL